MEDVDVNGDRHMHPKPDLHSNETHLIRWYLLSRTDSGAISLFRNGEKYQNENEQLVQVNVNGRHCQNGDSIKIVL